MGYFQHPFCSNSALTSLGMELGLLPEFGGDKEEAYRLGSLFDAVVTEPALLDLIQMTVSGSEVRHFTKDEYDNCKRMHASLKKHPQYAAFMACKPDMQKEVYAENVPFEWEGMTFTLNMRAKLDFFLLGLVSDLKSTASTSQRAFEAACEQFGYWRQMVLYCRLTGSKRATLFGVSKTAPHRVFVVHLKEGDERWKAGEKQLNELAFKYYLLKTA